MATLGRGLYKRFGLRLVLDYGKQVCQRGYASPCVAAKSPFQVELVANKRYSWCKCGLSKKQPFCDGSHRGTGIGPERFRPEESNAEAFLCGCKQTSTPPFCDGTHASPSVEAAEIGKPLN